MEFIVIVALAGLVVGLSKGGLGAPLGGLIAPMLVIAFPVSEAVALTLPLLIVGDMFALAAYWRAWNMRYITWLLPAAVIGIVIGTALLTTLDNRTLKALLGVFTLFFVVTKLFGDRLLTAHYQPRGWHKPFAGLITGLASALANAGGTPYTIYLMLEKLPPREFVGTITLYFTIVNLLKVPGYIGSGLLQWDRLLTLAAALPLIPIGVYAGRWIVHRIDPRSFERILLAVLTLAGVLLLLS
jgi:uncharacterized protein